MVCHVCASTQSHYSFVVQAKFPLSKVRVITSGSVPPVFPSSCHGSFHVMSTRYFLISAGCVSCTHGFAESRQGLARHLDITHPLWEEAKPPGLLQIVVLQDLHPCAMLLNLPQKLGNATSRLLPIGVIAVFLSSSSLHFIFPCSSIPVGRLTGGNWSHALRPLFTRSPAGLFPLTGQCQGGGRMVPGHRDGAWAWALP